MLCAAGPVAATALAVRAGHILPFQTLYMNFATPYLLIFLAAGLSTIGDAPRPVRSGLAAATAGLFLIFIASLWLVRDDTPNSRPVNPYSRAADGLLASYREGDEVRYTSWPVARLVSVYLSPSAPFTQSMVPSAAWQGAILLRQGRPHRYFPLNP